MPVLLTRGLQRKSSDLTLLSLTRGPVGHRGYPAPNLIPGMKGRSRSHPARVRTQQLALPRPWALLIQHCRAVTTLRPTGRAAQGSPSSPRFRHGCSGAGRTKPCSAQLQHRLPWKQPGELLPPGQVLGQGCPGAEFQRLLPLQPGAGRATGGRSATARQCPWPCPAAVPSARSQGTLCSLQVLD